jgi:hypothetical protein
MTLGATFPFFPPSAGLSFRRLGWDPLVNEAILRRLDILLHCGFERKLRVSKHLPWPYGPIFFSHQAFNDQMPGRSTHCWQFLLPDMLYRNEA